MTEVARRQGVTRERRIFDRLSGAVTLYKFDGVDEQLELIPVAARRALDCAGRRISLEAWKSLPIALRKHLVLAGSAPKVDTDLVREALALATPEPEAIEPVSDPAPQSVPEDVAQMLGEDRLIPDSVWAGLSSLDRYTLWKVTSRGKMDRIAAAFAEIIGHSTVSPHVAPKGGARMVDISEKQPSARSATGETFVSMSSEAFKRLQTHDVPKGDVLGTARIAGILAAKKTPELIPLCHGIALSRVIIDFDLDDEEVGVRIRAMVEAQDRTGVEMEALVAVSTAALTIYDMLKGVDRSMVIGPTRLMSKSGGRSGDYRR